jgi:hypothetical protein
MRSCSVAVATLGVVPIISFDEILRAADAEVSGGVH